MFEQSEASEVTLPPTLRRIGRGAFRGCRNLRSILLPEGLRSIEYHGFFMSGLQEVSIPEGVESIGQAAFANCTDLRTVSLPRGLKVLGSLESNSYWPGVFQETAISRIEIPSSVRLLPRHCFYGCGSLREVCLPDQLTTICSGCFGRSEIASLTVPRGLEEIGKTPSETASTWWKSLCKLADTFGKSVLGRFAGPPCTHSAQQTRSRKMRSTRTFVRKRAGEKRWEKDSRLYDNVAND